MACENVPRLLFLYATENQFFGIVKDKKLNLSRFWATNDSSEGRMNNEPTLRPEVERWGYICLSDTCTSEEMWRRYADEGRGVCFAFDFSDWDYMYGGILSKDFGLNKIVQMKRIIYRDEMAQKDEQEALFVKSSEWQCERECRIAIPLSWVERKIVGKNVSFQTGFIMPNISSIILGLECRLHCPEIIAFLDEFGIKNAIADFRPKVTQIRKEKVDGKTILVVNEKELQYSDGELRHKRYMRELY